MARVFFNQDASCFVVGTGQGFAVYNTASLKMRFTRDIGGSPDIVDPLFRTNILALVGGSRFPPNKVQIWDDAKGTVLTELEFKSNVVAVKIRRDRICVATQDHVYIYNFSTLELLADFVTYGNPTGLLAISPDSQFILACPGGEVGSLRIEIFDLYQPRQAKTHFISAHHGPLHRIIMTTDGSKVATCSDKGTLIRVFDVQKGVLLHELRRGIEKVDITGMAFNATGRLLGLVSSKGSVHVFDLDAPASSGYLIRGDCSNAKFYLAPGNYKCVFCPEKEMLGPETLVIIGEDYSWQSLAYDGLALHKMMDTYFLKST